MDFDSVVNTKNNFFESIIILLCADMNPEPLPWFVSKEGTFAPEGGCYKDPNCFSMHKMLEGISFL